VLRRPDLSSWKAGMIEIAELHHTRKDESRRSALSCGTVYIVCPNRFANALTLSLIAAIFALLASGCVNSEIAAGRADLSKGDYAAAHAKFLAASQSPKLSASERRELSDGLCLTEFKLGPPEYPRTEQLQTCSVAAAQPGSSSAPIVASIEAAELADTDTMVNQALAESDLTGAENAVIRYQAFPGSNQNAIAGWSKEIWVRIDEEEQGGARHERHLLPAIAAISRRYPKVRTMDDAAFKRWVITNATVSNRRLVDRVELRGHTLDLDVESRDLPGVAFHLDHFITINDAMVARCHCDGRTNIAVEGSGLPVYLVGIDADTRNSAAIVMPQPQ
jgi:hypothetical protein